MIQTDCLYSADDLYTIRQGDSEPLREYAVRFSHEYSRCPEIDDLAAFGAFKSGLRASQFRYLVHSSNWTTYGELMKQATIHAKAEHFNSKGMPSASPGQTASTSQPSASPGQTASTSQPSASTRPLIKLPTERHPLCPHLAQRGISEGTCSRVGRTEANAIRSQVAETSKAPKATDRWRSSPFLTRPTNMSSWPKIR
ncbi:unnamed protein product [Prunus armeniaca]